MSDLDLTRIAGFSSSKIWNLIKDGKANLPVEKIECVAQALRMDPGLLLEMALSEYEGGLADILSRTWGPRLTTIERTVVASMRRKFARDGFIASVTINSEPVTLPKASA